MNGSCIDPKAPTSALFLLGGGKMLSERPKGHELKGRDWAAGGCKKERERGLKGGRRKAKERRGQRSQKTGGKKGRVAGRRSRSMVVEEKRKREKRKDRSLCLSISHLTTLSPVNFMSSNPLSRIQF